MAVIKGLLGKKIGMTQIFQDNKLTSVTVISAGPCLVLGIKRKAVDGYSALRLGYQDARKKSLTKPKEGEFKNLKIKPMKYIREIRIEDDSVCEHYKVGSEIRVGIFKAGEYVDAIARSKGKGFQGGVKRWGWHIGPKSHGSMSYRAIGSVGQSSFPSRVFKGLNMAGHMGDDRVTVQNLKIAEVDQERGLILVKGSIPGAIGSVLVIRSAKKKQSDLLLQQDKDSSGDDVKQEKPSEKADQLVADKQSDQIKDEKK